MSNLKNQDVEKHIKRVKYYRNKDPLLDMVTLNEIGLRASNKAKARAFKNGSPITIGRDGDLIQIFPNGVEKVIKKATKKTTITLAQALAL